MAVLIQGENVLWASKDRPLIEGFRLVQAIGQVERVILSTNYPEQRVMHQLRTERVSDVVAEVMDDRYDLPPHPLWKRHIEMAQSKYGLSMVVTGSPKVMSWATDRRITSLLFAHPKFAHTALRPEQGDRDWMELMEELEARP